MLAAQVCDWFFQVKCNSERTLIGEPSVPEQQPHKNQRPSPVFVRPPSGSTPGVILTPFQFIIGFWTPPVIDAFGNVHIDKCFACRFLNDAQSSSNRTDSQAACTALIESSLEEPLPPKQLDAKLSEFRQKNPNDPSLPLLQCCHQRFASKLLDQKTVKAEKLVYGDPPGLMPGKSCGDFIQNYAEWVNGGNSTREVQNSQPRDETLQQ